MKVHPVPHGMDLTIGVSTQPRTPGLHMSEIYGTLFQGLEPKRYLRDSKPDVLRMEMGLTFETLLEEGLQARLAGGGRPGEFTSDEGIIYSPDLIIFNGTTRLGEIKLTWMSSRDVPRDALQNGFDPRFDKWFVQMKAYCRCLQTRDARLYAFFVNGDYRPPKPEFLAWDIEFSPQELDDNWRMLMNHAKHTGLLK